MSTVSQDEISTETEGSETNEATTVKIEESSFKEILKTPIFWAVCISSMCFNIFWTGFNYHATNIMEDIAGLNPN